MLPHSLLREHFGRAYFVRRQPPVTPAATLFSATELLEHRLNRR
jgi:hypothetical protein